MTQSLLALHLVANWQDFTIILMCVRNSSYIIAMKY